MNNSPFKVLASEIILQMRHLSVEKERLKRDDGGETDYYTVRHPGAVVIIPITADRDILLLKQYRHAIKEWIYEFPAGTLDPNEAPEVCAHRELIEETGYKAASLLPLGPIFPAPGFCDEVQYGFLAKDLTPAKSDLDDDEFLEVEAVSLQELKRRIVGGEINDAKTLAFYARAWLRDLLE